MVFPFLQYPFACEAIQLLGPSDYEYGRTSLKNWRDTMPSSLVAKETMRTGGTALKAAEALRHIGVVGLGRMGHAFATNLVTAGYRVAVFDRNPDKANACLGAEPMPDLAGLAGCDAILSSLPDDEALATVTLSNPGLVGVMKPGAVHISMSTVSPEISRRLAETHEAQGQAYVAAPILGNPDLARAQKLFVLTAGRQDVLDRVKPILETLGQRIFIMGDDPSSANLMKLAAKMSGSHSPKPSGHQCPCPLQASCAIVW
jgi:hypothetical protein